VDRQPSLGVEQPGGSSAGQPGDISYPLTGARDVGLWRENSSTKRDGTVSASKAELIARWRADLKELTFGARRLAATFNDKRTVSTSFRIKDSPLMHDHAKKEQSDAFCEKGCVPVLLCLFRRLGNV